MKSSKTQKRNFQPYVYLPPIHKQSLLSQEMSFDQSIDSPSSNTKRHAHKISIQIAKYYAKNRNKSDNISKQNHKIKIKSKLASLVQSQDYNKKKKNKKSNSKHFRQKTQFLINKKNPQILHFQDTFQKQGQRYRKLQTQAQINDQFDEAEQYNGISDDTLIEFKKKIAENKAMIKQQIVKRNKEKDFSTNSSQKNIRKQSKRSNNANSIKDKQTKKSIYLTQCTTPKGSINQNLFSHLQQILVNKIQVNKPKNMKTIQVSQINQSFVSKQQHSNRVQRIVAKIRKLSPQQSKETIKQEAYQYTNAFPKKLKDINNYSQWRKLDLNKADSVKYRQSSFDIQQSRLSEIIDKNDSSIANYLQSKKQLLRLGMRLHTQEDH